MADLPDRESERLSSSELQRRAISGFAWTALNTVISLPLAFVSNAIVARSLGVSSFGRLAFLAATSSLAATFADFGFSNAVIQEGSRQEASGHRRDVSTAVLTASASAVLVVRSFVTALAAGAKLLLADLRDVTRFWSLAYHAKWGDVFGVTHF
jgi:O-antigen/teichoic acid export membrane protein